MTSEIIDIAAAADACDETPYLCTIVRTEGSCYRKAGARMLVGELGRLAGSISGGCLEREIASRVRWYVESGEPVVAFHTAADGDESQARYVGCGGSLWVLFERYEGRVAEVHQRLASLEAGATVATVVAGPDLGARTIIGHEEPPAWWSGELADIDARVARVSHGDREILIERLPPAKRLLIAGRHYDVEAMVGVARAAGWNVTLACPATARWPFEVDRIDRIELTDVGGWVERHPSAAAVIMTHSVALDRACLERVLAHPPRYIGMLGPRHRRDEILDALTASNAVTSEAAARVRGPIGVPLGGEGAGAIAISVIAELEREHAALGSSEK